ncbi:uncharacterized protein Z520_06331 [Fonsecaea multimorphosa CBS 102226]|uniref:EamA domain-containing protein n=1 Tax=Fonsecaea multimorphosa CBS 102226 TaxID=1442371 RepID=A0A0D2IMI9_9EURO|nr:uncharacterized protein Z520_06331 [Fonsecaea multimorphosa CBS 102226]KIX98251.1 hypothetical protein Z520_06331 [Fonsecaea multimorphosa CBS 102226]OAL22616.1 hypothetical protein AYO22_07174 [Fonsecaea multimorphosa]
MSMSSASIHDGSDPASPSSSDNTTVVASPSSSKSAPPLSASPTGQKYLDIPSFRPSLDSTYSELSELSFHSNELHQAAHPLVRSISQDGALSTSADPPPPPKSRLRAAWDSFYVTNYGALLVLASQAFGVGMNISTRLLETPGSHGEPMHPFQILFARQSITAVICTAYGIYFKSTPYFPFGPRGIRWLLVLRGITGFFGVFGLYFSLLYLPLSEATVLGFLSPILTCYICSFIMPGEVFSVQQQIAGFVSLIGVLFIARPASLFSTSTQPSDALVSPPLNSTATAETAQHITSEQHLAAVGIAMIGVVGGTGALTAIRVIGTRVHAFISINYFSWWCSIVSLVCLVIFPDVKFRLPANLTEWALLANLGLCGFVMQFLLTAGLAYGGPGEPSSQRGNRNQPAQKIRDLESTCPAHLERPVGSDPKPKPSGTRATAMCYTQMLFALGGDKLVFGVTPDTMSWIGSVLILAGAVWVAAARDSTTKSKPSPTSGGLEVLREHARTKEAATHQESVGLMSGREDGHERDDESDDDMIYGERQNEHGQALESLEMHDLRRIRAVTEGLFTFKIYYLRDKCLCPKKGVGWGQREETRPSSESSHNKKGRPRTQYLLEGAVKKGKKQAFGIQGDRLEQRE